MSTLAPILAFVAVAIGILGVAGLVGFTKTKMEERMESLKRPKGESIVKGGASDKMAEVLSRATPTLAKPMQAKNEKDASKMKQKLSHAGFRSESSALTFAAMKTICGLIGLAMGGGLLMMMSGFSLNALLKTAACGGLWFYMPDMVLWFLTKRRKEKIFLGLPDALDLMVVCVEAGLALDQAMRKVSEEMVKSNPIMAYEFNVCNMQLQWGRQRSEVLNELGERNGVDDLKSLSSIIIQADKFGSSIANALRVQSDAMRVKRRQLAEEKAAKTAVKLIFPLVIFIFPGIFVVLVGPAAITMVNEMLPAFQK